MGNNQLYFGDNLEILKRYIDDEYVDLVYLDPPFNSNQSYNVLFADNDGRDSEAQIAVFDDTWHWDLHTASVYQDIVIEPGKLSDVMVAFRRFLGDNDMMAYLTMMAPRLRELHRVLKPTGSIYLHCDPTASHYLKILMDAIFSPRNFKNEIIWKRVSTVKGNWGQGSKFFGPNTDTILFYSKTEQYHFSTLFKEYSDEYIEKFYKYTEPDGRRYRLISMIGPGGASKGNPEYEFMGVTRYWRYSKAKMQELYDDGMIVQTKPGTVPQRKQYLDDGRGVAIQSLWDDISALSATSKERLGYPTQKPEALLERIIQASSNEGGIILDPFCGCGTTIVAAQQLNRQWIGIDITHLAASLIKHRLIDSFGREIMDDVQIVGEPESLAGAEALAKQDPFQFQWWILGFVGARPVEQKKGADRGIDGRLNYFERPDGKKGKLKLIIFSVKAGKVSSPHIRDLRGVIEREKAVIGVFLSLNPPTRDMVKEAANAGFYLAEGLEGKKYAKIQMLTAEQLLNGVRPDFPPFVRSGGNTTFKKAPRRKAAPKKENGTQMKL